MWRTETLDGDDSFKDFGLSAEEAKALAAEKLAAAGATPEQIGHALGWDEVVYGIVSPDREDLYEKFKSGELPYMGYVYILTT